jgi:Family of unknown function (DUF6491)
MKRIKLGVLFLGCNVSMLAHYAAAADDPVSPPASTAVGPAPAREMQIPFASQTIWRWRVVDNNTVLIQDRGRRWYKATLWGNCIDLTFAQTLSFVSNPTGTFDKFSSIRFGGQRCPLRSLVATVAPPKKPAQPDPAASSKTPAGASST